MTMNGIVAGLFAALTGVSLAFGAAQAVAAPRAPVTPSDVCVYNDVSACRAMCGPGCGGTCIDNLCYCDC